jgi:hypothetical protein
MQRLPDLLLTEIASNLFLAGESQFSGQALVAEELCDCLTERSYIAYGETKAGLAILNDVHDARRRRAHHWFARCLCL